MESRWVCLKIKYHMKGKAKTNGKKESRRSLSPKSGQMVLFHLPLQVVLNEQTLKRHHTISVITEISATFVNIRFLHQNGQANMGYARTPRHGVSFPLSTDVPSPFYLWRHLSVVPSRQCSLLCINLDYITPVPFHYLAMGIPCF